MEQKRIKKIHRHTPRWLLCDKCERQASGKCAHQTKIIQQLLRKGNAAWKKENFSLKAIRITAFEHWTNCKSKGNPRKAKKYSFGNRKRFFQPRNVTSARKEKHATVTPPENSNFLKLLRQQKQTSELMTRRGQLWPIECRLHYNRLLAWLRKLYPQNVCRRMKSEAERW